MAGSKDPFHANERALRRKYVLRGRERQLEAVLKGLEERKHIDVEGMARKALLEVEKQKPSLEDIDKAVKEIKAEMRSSSLLVQSMKNIERAKLRARELTGKQKNAVESIIRGAREQNKACQYVLSEIDSRLREKGIFKKFEGKIDPNNWRRTI